MLLSQLRYAKKIYIFTVYNGIFFYLHLIGQLLNRYLQIKNHTKNCHKSHTNLQFVTVFLIHFKFFWLPNKMFNNNYNQNINYDLKNCKNVQIDRQNRKNNEKKTINRLAFVQKKILPSFSVYHVFTTTIWKGDKENKMKLLTVTTVI